MFTVHSHTSSVLSSVGHELVDPNVRGVESCEIRSGEEFHMKSQLTRREEIRVFQACNCGNVC